jgi:subtilisin family serine protease
MAPGVPLHAVRVLNAEGSGYWTDIVAGLEYVLEHPEIKVVSMSLGGPAWSTDDDPMRDAIEALEAADVLVVVAAGNDTSDTAGYAPAGFDLGLTVSAYDASNGSDNGFASFSNYGSEVDIAAPGVDILSTYPDGTYTELSGTSMATPLVAGAAIAYRAENPGKSFDQVRNRILNTGEDGYTGQRGDHPEPFIDFTAMME